MSQLEKRIYKNLPVGAKLLYYKLTNDNFGLKTPDQYGTKVVYEMNGKTSFFTLKNTGRSRRRIKKC